MKQIFLFFALIVFLSSCTSEKKRKEAEKREIKKQNEINREKTIEAIASKYAIKYQWDTLEYTHSIKYEPVLESKYQLINSIEIDDIFRKDSSYYISLNVSYYPSFYFTFPVTQDQLTQISNDNDNSDLIFIVSITDIRKVQLILKGEIEDESASVNIRSSVKLKRSNDFIGKGKIVEIIRINPKI